jgi:hypothetical protein
MNRFLIYIAGTIFSLLLISCAASTGSRYEHTRGKKEAAAADTDKTDSVPEKVFDITPYRAQINIPEPEVKDSTPAPEIWYNYTEADANNNVNTAADTSVSDSSSGVSISKKSGYRVEVLSTDNLDEANNMRSELSSKLSQKKIYIIFEPPFYKVKVGDFLHISDANQMNFKLNQLGYTESRVVKDSVNVY